MIPIYFKFSFEKKILSVLKMTLLNQTFSHCTQMTSPPPANVALDSDCVEVSPLCSISVQQRRRKPGRGGGCGVKEAGKGCGAGGEGSREGEGGGAGAGGGGSREGVGGGG